MVTACRLTTRRRRADKLLARMLPAEEPANTLIPGRPAIANTIAEAWFALLNKPHSTLKISCKNDTTAASAAAPATPNSTPESRMSLLSVAWAARLEPVSSIA